MRQLVLWLCALGVLLVSLPGMAAGHHRGSRHKRRRAHAQSALQTERASVDKAMLLRKPKLVRTASAVAPRASYARDQLAVDCPVIASERTNRFETQASRAYARALAKLRRHDLKTECFDSVAAATQAGFRAAR